MKFIENLKSKIYQILKKSQKYTETDMIYLAKGGFWLTLRQVISTITSFFLAIAFGNLLDPITYGNYNYVMSFKGILGILTLAGMNTAITQAVSRGIEGSFYTGFKARLKWGFSASLTALAIAIYYFLKKNYLLPVPFLILSLFLPILQSSRVYEAFLAGKKLFNIQVKYISLSQLISAGIIIITLLFTKKLYWLVTAYFISHTFLNYFFYLRTKSKFKPNKKEDSETLSYAKHLTVVRIISQIANYFDKILLFTLVGSHQLAIYSFSVIIPDQIRGAMKNIGSLAFPKLAQKKKREIKQTIFKKIKRMFLMSLFITVIYIIIAPLLYKLLFPKYLESIIYSQIFAFSILLNPTLLLASLDAQMAIKERYIFNLFWGISKIILMFLLVSLYNIWGIILSRIIVNFFSFILALLLVKKM